MPVRRTRSTGPRVPKAQMSVTAPPIGSAYTGSVDLTERAVAARVPSLATAQLGTVARREPVAVEPGTTIGACLRAIQRTGTGDSVFVTAPDTTLLGVLTERDVFARLVGPDVAAAVDLDAPVDAYMTTD